ncbi:MAG: hypothetical protein WAO98_03010 [Alphaproteobacteria bacterium]
MMNFYNPIISAWHITAQLLGFIPDPRPAHVDVATYHVTSAFLMTPAEGYYLRRDLPVEGTHEMIRVTEDNLQDAMKLADPAARDVLRFLIKPNFLNIQILEACTLVTVTLPSGEKVQRVTKASPGELGPLIERAQTRLEAYDQARLSEQGPSVPGAAAPGSQTPGLHA